MRKDNLYVLILAGVAIFLSLHLIAAGTPTQESYSHDTPLFFDGGWRVYCGLRPSTDFYSPLGPIIYLYVALGYCLFGANTDSLGYLNAVVLPAFMALFWHSLKPRLPAGWLSLLVLLASLCFVADHTIRGPFWKSSYAMLYNRHGCAWLILLAALLFSPRGTATQRLLVWNSLLVGIVLTILFFLKVTYFVSAIPLLIAFAISRGNSILSVKLIALGSFASTLLILAYLRFDVIDTIKDLAVTSAARSHSVQWGDTLTNLMMTKWQLTVVAVVIMLEWHQSSSRVFDACLQNLIIPSALVASALMLFVSNGTGMAAASDEMPLIPALLVLIVVKYTTSRSERSTDLRLQRPNKDHVLAASLCLAACGFYIIPDVLSILAPVYYHGRSSSYARFEADSMRKMVFDDTDVGYLYTKKTNAGLELLRNYRLTACRIASLDYTSPFAFALRSPPPVGAPTFWYAKTNVTRTSYPQANKVFRGVDVVMIPKNPDDVDTTSILLDVYGDYLKSNFAPVAESHDWTLLKRR